MKKEPYVENYLDDEERELIKAIEADDYAPCLLYTSPSPRDA